MNNAVVAEKRYGPRLDYLDIAKGIGMLLVVMGHSSPPKAIRLAIFAFHMPLFFIINGMLYRKKRNAAAKDLLHLILPYVVTVAILFVFTYIRKKNGMSCYYDSYGAQLKSALFGSGSTYNGIKLIGEIWFLLALFWARRLMDGVFCLDNQWVKTACVAALMAFGIVLSRQKKWFPMSMDVALMAVGFMMAGWLIANRTDLLKDTGKRQAILLACLIICWMGLQRSRFSMSGRKYGELVITLPTAAAASLAVICVSQYLEKIKPIKAFLAFIGRHSMLFLCVHSMDWRMPFDVWGASIIAPYRDKSWYWLLGMLRRFSFDFAVMCCGVLALEGLRRLWKRRAKSLAA